MSSIRTGDELRAERAGRRSAAAASTRCHASGASRELSERTVRGRCATGHRHVEAPETAPAHPGSRTRSIRGTHIVARSRPATPGTGAGTMRPRRSRGCAPTVPGADPRDAAMGVEAPGARVQLGQRHRSTKRRRPVVDSPCTPESAGGARSRLARESVSLNGWSSVSGERVGGARSCPHRTRSGQAARRARRQSRCRPPHRRRSRRSRSIERTRHALCASVHESRPVLAPCLVPAAEAGGYIRDALSQRRPAASERLRLAVVRLPVDHQAVPEGPDLRVPAERDLDIRGASPHSLVESARTTRSPASTSSYSNSTVSQGAQPIAPELAHLLGPVIDAIEVEDLGVGEVPHHVRVEKVRTRAWFAPQELLEGIAQPLHVLPAHRPGSTPS